MPYLTIDPTAMILEAACEYCIMHGYADGAYLYARMLGRYYYRNMNNRSWYFALRNFYTPERPSGWNNYLDVRT